tara:strand:- start:1554 stop:2402 length:849 start_codon:yes stop_codon:yes gene_type:complete
MNVYSFEIPKPINENLLVQEDNLVPACSNMHRHEEIQITYIVKGSGKFFISHAVHRYGPGDFFVIGSNCPHSFRKASASLDNHRISIFFKMNAFGSNFFELSQLDQIKSFFGLLDCGFKLTEYRPSISNLMYQLPMADKFSRFLLFLELMREVCKCKKENLGVFIKGLGVKNIVDFRMRRVLDYTHVNFNKEITLDMVADIACLSPGAFCKYFKNRMSRTFFSYLIELRIIHACKLLRQDGSYSIANVSNLSGFKSITNFNRMFKNYVGITPSNYIRQLDFE